MSRVPGPDTTSRLDVLLVAEGLARSRGHARELLDAGSVTVDGVVVRRASTRVPPGAQVRAVTDEWVGRAAHKLLAAFEIFGRPGPADLRSPAGDDVIHDVSGRRCLDLGASTGGFTQVLLTRGARTVVALDVGHGQLAARVAQDPRVDERSGVNVRDVRLGDLGERFDVVVADVSFMSLRHVVPVIAEQLAADGEAIVLIKPQFEVGRARLGKTGVVRCRADRVRAVRDVLTAACGVGLETVRLAECPVPGGTGNVEYLVLWRHADGAWRHADAEPSRAQAAIAGSASSGCRARIDRLTDEFDEGEL